MKVMMLLFGFILLGTTLVNAEELETYRNSVWKLNGAGGTTELMFGAEDGAVMTYRNLSGHLLVTQADLLELLPPSGYGPHANHEVILGYHFDGRLALEIYIASPECLLLPDNGLIVPNICFVKTTNQ